MKVSIIAPPKLVYYEWITDFHLLPCHHLKDRTVREAYRAMRQRGDYVILDNGITEKGVAAPVSELAAYAASVQAHEIVLPDTYDDAEGTVKSTLEAAKEFYNLVTRPTGVKLMGVVHGKTEAEWSWVYETFTNAPEIDVIGLPKVMTRNFGNRTEFLQRYFRSHGLSDKPHHLLGVWDQPEEIKLFRFLLPWARSIDTSLPVMAGVTNQMFGEDKFKKVQLDENLAVDPYPHHTLYNIGCLLNWAGHHQGFIEGWEHGRGTDTDV